MTATPKPINYELLHRLTVEKCSVLEVCAGLEISEATYYNRKKNNPVFLAAVEAAQSNCTWEKTQESMEEAGHPPAEPEKQKRPRKPRPDLNESYLKAIGAEDFPSGEHQAVYINLNSWIFYAIKEGYLTATMISKFWLTDDMCIDLTYTLEMMLATYNYMFDIGELVTREKANMTCYLQRDNIPHNFYLKDGKFVMLWTEDDARIDEDDTPMVIGTKHKGYEDFSRPAPTTAADREFYETEVKFEPPVTPEINGLKYLTETSGAFNGTYVIETPDPPTIDHEIDIKVMSNGEVIITSSGTVSRLTLEILQGLVEIKNRCEGNNVA